MVLVWRRRLDARTLAAGFGYTSTTARRAIKALYSRLVSPSSQSTVSAYEEWHRRASMVYPSSGPVLASLAEDYGIARSVDGHRFFFAVQTYYALLLKLMSAEVASRHGSSPRPFIASLMEDAEDRERLTARLEELERGLVHREYGIANFMEGDLFGWYLGEIDDEVYRAVVGIIEELSKYDVDSLDTTKARDMFKLLFEDLVPRKEVRQKLGIYTTPDWLAELVLNELGLTVENFAKMHSEGKDPLDLRILDPGVGTGTFLSLVIQRLGEYLRRATQGLGEKERDRVLREALLKVTRNVVGFDIDELAVLTARTNYLIALAASGLLGHGGSEAIEVPVYRVNTLEGVPRFRGYFDYVVGNPPWLVYRAIEDPEYQRFVKRLAKDVYGLVTKVHQIVNIELATLFLVRTMDLYLRDGGLLGFVMPRTIFSADQHENFRRGAVRGVRYGITKVIDTAVEPLFPVPSCTLIARKGTATKYPVDALVLSGSLPEERHKVLTLGEAMKALKAEKKKLYLGVVGPRTFYTYDPPPSSTSSITRSYYFSRFSNGATVYPQAFWFVDVADDSQPNTVVAKTARRVMERGRGKVKASIGPLPIEREFLYGVLTSAEVLPFCHLQPNIAVLPIRPVGDGYEVVTREEAQREGKAHLARWLGEVEKLWEEVKGVKKKVSIYEAVDHYGQLTKQNPNAAFKVVYVEVGAYLASCVVRDGEHAVTRRVGGRVITVRVPRVIIENTLLFYQTNDEDEAYYLAAVLNSRYLDTWVKPMQARRSFNATHLAKKPLEYPIPRFDPGNPTHRRLSELGRKATEVACSVVPRLLAELGLGRKLEEEGFLKPNEVSLLRKAVKDRLGDVLSEIDALVEQLPKQQVPGAGGAGGRRGSILDYIQG